MGDPKLFIEPAYSIWVGRVSKICACVWALAGRISLVIDCRYTSLPFFIDLQKKNIICFRIARRPQSNFWFPPFSALEAIRKLEAIC